MRVLGLTIEGAFSGADAAIFTGLRTRGYLTGVVDSALPPMTRLRFLLRTVRPNRRAWGQAWRSAMIKSPGAFRARSARNDQILRSRLTSYDIVLQVGGLFAPFTGTPPRPVALFCDYTTKLAERNYMPWFGLQPSDAVDWYAMEARLYRQAGVIFTASENTRNSLINDYDVTSDHVRVVREGVRDVPDCSGKTYGAHRIVFVGIDFDRKGGPWLLHAFRKVRAEIPDSELHIVGASQGPPQEGVVWHGHVSDRGRMDTILAGATVLTLPSVCEPFGLALIEGMAHRIPVVGTRVDAMAEIIDDGVTGYLVPPRDADALADRLMELLRSPELCAQLGGRGQDVVRERFLWTHVIDAVIRGLDDLAVDSGLEIGSDMRHSK